MVTWLREEALKGRKPFQLEDARRIHWLLGEGTHQHN